MEQTLFKRKSILFRLLIPPYFFPYKHPARKKYATLRTSFIQATHFQCCHNNLKSVFFKETVSTRSGTNVHYLLDSYHVAAWLRWHMTCWVGSYHSSHHAARFINLVTCESEDKIFLIWQVCTQLKCYVTLWVGLPHPKSAPC